jgi:transcriptional regulator with XRE-family HTH domain
MTAATLAPRCRPKDPDDGNRKRGRLPAPDTLPGPQELRQRRKAQRLSQAQLAEILLVNHATVSRWESGLRRPPHGLIPGIAEALNVTHEAVEGWFAPMQVLGGDTIGRLDGLKRLLAAQSVDLRTAAAACDVPEEDLAGWVLGRRSLPRFMVPRLARMLGLPEADFLNAARAPRTADTGSFLRELRRSRGLTQKELGRRIGRCDATICAWELARVTPSPASIRRLSRALHVDDCTLCDRMQWPRPPLLTMPPSELPPHELIRWRRLQEGLNRAEVGRCVGVTGQTVRRWEGGDFRPRRAILERLARALALPQLSVISAREDL